LHEINSCSNSKTTSLMLNYRRSLPSILVQRGRSCWMIAETTGKRMSEAGVNKFATNILCTSRHSYYARVWWL